MAYGVVNVDKMTTSDGVSSSGLYGFKNRLINSAMVIDQRNAGASVTPASGTYTYTVDRFKAYASQASKFTVQQSTTTTSGFVNSLLVTSSSAYSIGTGDRFDINQGIEGFNVADLGWGAAGASTVTLSFWVRSSLTGTFGGAVGNSAGDRSYPFSYTISSANTFEYKTITIAGDTSGTWLKTNGAGMYVYFGLGVGATYSGTAGAWNSNFNTSATGATSVVGTNGATFYLTGVQLEKGSTATSFDYRPYTNELQLCQRYYQQIGKTPNTNYQGYGTGVAVNSTTVEIIIPFVVTMRIAPSFTFNNPTNSLITGGAGSVSVVSADISTPFNIMYQCISSGLTTGYGTRHFQNNTSTTSLELSAEL